MSFSLQQQHLALLSGGEGDGCPSWRGFQLGIQNFRGWLGTGEEGRGAGRDIHCGWVISGLQVNCPECTQSQAPHGSLQLSPKMRFCTLVLTCFHLHFRGYIPTPSFLALHQHPVLFSFVSHHPHPAAGCTLPFAQGLLTPLCPFPSLSPDQNFPSVSHFLCASSLHPCLHTQSLYICVFTLPNLSLLTTFILLGPTQSSFLPCEALIPSHVPPNPSCWLLLPTTSSALATASPCSHLTPLFSVPSSHYWCLFSTTPLTSLLHYPVPVSSCPERFLPRNLLWIPNQRAQLSSHHLWLITTLFHLSPLLQSEVSQFPVAEDEEEAPRPFCHFWFLFFCVCTVGLSTKEMRFVAGLSAHDPSLKSSADFPWKEQPCLFQHFSFHIINALYSFHCYLFFLKTSLPLQLLTGVLFSSISKSIEFTILSGSFLPFSF